MALFTKAVSQLDQQLHPLFGLLQETHTTGKYWEANEPNCRNQPLGQPAYSSALNREQSAGDRSSDERPTSIQFVSLDLDELLILSSLAMNGVMKPVDKNNLDFLSTSSSAGCSAEICKCISTRSLGGALWILTVLECVCVGHEDLPCFTCLLCTHQSKSSPRAQPPRDGFLCIWGQERARQTLARSLWRRHVPHTFMLVPLAGDREEKPRQGLVFSTGRFQTSFPILELPLKRSFPCIWA